MGSDAMGNAAPGPARLGLAIVLLQAAAGVHAADLPVTARVLPARPAPQALQTLEPPPGARLLTARPFTRSFRHDGAPAHAAAYFRQTLPRQGYRLVGASPDGSELLWVSDDVRLQVRLQAVLGAAPRTRIVVQASARDAARQARASN